MSAHAAQPGGTRAGADRAGGTGADSPRAEGLRAGRQQADRQQAGALELAEVTKRFGEHTAIADLNLSVRAGEFLSLLGPSGCGKTTLLRMIAGFEAPSSGRILLAGEDLVGVPAHRRPVNTVFQSYALFPHMSVADNVAYGLKQKRVPKPEIRTRVIEALALVQMDSFADRRPEQLSGGQQQRVALARALVNRPQVLLLDEPMSALDRKLREEMQIELKRLHAELGTTFVFVTHDQEEALAMSDRIVVMNAGVIQQVGAAEEIYARPANRFVAGFIGKQNFLPARVEAVDGAYARLRTAGCLITVPAAELPGEAGSAVTAAIRPERIRVEAAGPGGTAGSAGAAGTAGSTGTAGGAGTAGAAVPEAPAGWESPAAAEDAAGQRVDTMPGRVLGVSFLGDVIQYILAVPGEEEILARVPAHGQPALTPGTPVRLSWGAGQAQVFADA